MSRKGRGETVGARFHHVTRNCVQFKTYKLCISWIFHFMLLDHSWPWVTETEKSKTADKGGLLCFPPNPFIRPAGRGWNLDEIHSDESQTPSPPVWRRVSQACPDTALKAMLLWVLGSTTESSQELSLTFIWILYTGPTFSGILCNTFSGIHLNFHQPRGW